MYLLALTVFPVKMYWTIYRDNDRPISLFAIYDFHCAFHPLFIMYTVVFGNWRIKPTNVAETV